MDFQMSQSASLEQHALTFAYSEVEAARIIESSKGNSTFLTSISNQDVIKDYEKERRKLIGLELHAITLTEYYRAKRIPRGLRVSLRPTIFNDNLEFAKKYEQIVNKCSFDIILLNIEYLQREVMETKQRLQTIECELKQQTNTEVYQEQLRHMEESLSKHRQSIEERKRLKFHRDEADYNTGRIYRWQRESGTTWTPRGPRREGPQQDLRSMRSTRPTWSPAGTERRGEWRTHSLNRRERERDVLSARQLSPASSSFGGSTSEASSSSSFLGAGPSRSPQGQGGVVGDTGGRKDRRQQPQRRARTFKKRQ
ncbi:hypothetical protein XENTR_v10005391 [Xenopus tropicalis]|uniref:Uncharacterized protein LOC116408814 isoform X1 n=1 Tax=Xenopus tropicalis TaxID=8364 RepID=A0A8J1J7K8_XENTR|nr:uncharacterized protein LOC116408814 isoform X1 [Xenopus tropicalis]KAE8622793.1 hypothetical protein XENTR_v10005391 [Xenopus tropicalis]